jgi:hypothetical protein
MGMRVSHEAFHTGPCAYWLHDNLESRFVHFFSVAQLILKIVIQKHIIEHIIPLITILR